MPETSEHPWSGPWSSIVAFWRQAGEAKWFGKDVLFGDACRDHFRELHMDGAARRHDDWMDCAACEELKARGADIVIGPLTRSPGLRLAFLRGPEGIMVEIVQK